MRAHLLALQNAAPATPDDVRRTMAERKAEHLREKREALRSVEERAIALLRRPDYANIRPTMAVVGKKDAPLWRFYRMMLSGAPWTQRPGRHLPGLCLDERTGGVLGVWELNSDLLTLGPRDQHIGWTQRQRLRERGLRKVGGMGTCVGTPAFGRLTGGKFIAEAMLSPEVGRYWRGQYGDELAAVCTTSLFGKSSQYNRLPHWKYLGTTPGGGYFHLGPPTVRLLDDFTRHNTTSMAAFRSGVGGHLMGTWDKLVYACSIAKVPLESVGSRQPRGVYFAERGENALAFLRKETADFEATAMSCAEVAEWWMLRWYDMRWPKVRDEIGDIDWDSFRVDRQLYELTSVGSIGSDAPAAQVGEGGASPSPALQPIGAA